VPRKLCRSAAIIAVLALAVVYGAPSRAPVAQAAAGAWSGVYYNNTTISNPSVGSDITGSWCTTGPLLGAAPTLDCFADFSPGGSINADGFSVRWERTETFAAGTYRFTGTTDDGMRIKVDGATVVDAWFAQAPTTYYADKTLTAGSHIVVVEFFDSNNAATAIVSVQDVATLPVVWSGQYFANKTLTGSPALTRNDPAINFDWSTGSPAPGPIPVNSFSARWTQTLAFNDGVYSFTTTSDDGARVYVDGQLVLNFRIDQGGVRIRSTTDDARSRTVVVEYYENARRVDDLRP
jgi:hypothetical protein